MLEVHCLSFLDSDRRSNVRSRFLECIAFTFALRPVAGKTVAGIAGKQMEVN